MVAGREALSISQRGSKAAGTLKKMLQDDGRDVPKRPISVSHRGGISRAQKALLVTTQGRRIY